MPVRPGFCLTPPASANSGPSLSLDFLAQTYAAAPAPGRRASPAALSALLTTTASGGTYFDSTGTLRTATANAPRFDYNPSTLAARGLLIEEARTNSIRNPRGEGAVAGTPGTLPTNWVLNPVSGISYQVVGSGTENGIPYVDLSVSGTNTAGATWFAALGFETQTGISASPSQTWAASFYLRVLSGSIPGNVASFCQFNQNGSYITNQGGAFVSPSGAPLGQNRLSATVTTVANTTSIFPYMAFSVNAGQSIAVTFRIGAPQCEQGAFATSVILPPSGSPAASTRTADNVSGGLGAWFKPGAGSLEVDAAVYSIGSPLLQYLVEVGDGASSNRYALRMPANSGNVGAVAVSQGVAQASVNAPGSVSPGAPFKAAMAFAGGSYSDALNGGAVAATSGQAAIGGLTTLRLGGTPATGAVLNGWVRRVRYWPRALANTELQQVTT